MAEEEAKLEHRENRWKTKAFKKKRNDLAEGYYSRVENWLEQTAEEVAQNPPPLLMRERGMLEVPTYRDRVPTKELGSPRISPNLYIPEKDRVKAAEKVLEERQAQPYQDPAINNLRSRVLEREIHEPFRFKARTSAQRVEEQVKKSRIGGPYDEFTGLQVPVYRDIRPEKHLGGFFRNYLPTAHIRRPMATHFPLNDPYPYQKPPREENMFRSVPHPPDFDKKPRFYHITKKGEKEKTPFKRLHTHREKHEFLHGKYNPHAPYHSNLGRQNGSQTERAPATKRRQYWAAIKEIGAANVDPDRKMGTVRMEQNFGGTFDDKAATARSVYHTAIISAV
eukprot:CAMPEP_0175090702 /NCGR_PEP_ID=MMETSP0086_2-20121207/1497_1 /TAXON_ID=136419 /ORGANISM="Unknown Unknown, Strain D1" /LENGTH=336 /DNA_ID=CAMNT_0016363369 /DNA_START=59 /DNA_END=1069 /DNA_ORIENTATION=+